MNTKAKHSALPWKWSPGDAATHYELHCADFEPGEADSVLYHGADWPMTEANRHLIVQAVNHHAALVELLRFQVEYQEAFGYRDPSENQKAWTEKARALLATLEKEG